MGECVGHRAPLTPRAVEENTRASRLCADVLPVWPGDHGLQDLPPGIGPVVWRGSASQDALLLHGPSFGCSFPQSPWDSPPSSGSAGLLAQPLRSFSLPERSPISSPVLLLLSGVLPA